MNAIMSDPSSRVRLQIFASEALRRRLKSAAVGLGLDMGELAAPALGYVLDLLASGKVPPALEKAIKAAQDEKTKREADESK